MNPTLLVVAYGLTIVVSAVAGGYLPQLVRMNHLRMQVLLSFVGGMMLGVAVLHLLPHGILEIQTAILNEENSFSVATQWAMQSTLIGLLVTFLLMRAFHFHQHGEEDEQEHHHGHHHGHETSTSTAPKRLGWLGVMFGLGMHTFMDGVALGAAVQSEVHGVGFVPAGFAVYLAILLHKPLDALSLSSLMLSSHHPWPRVIMANAAVGLMCLVGGLAVQFWPPLTAGGLYLGCLLAAAAGVFLCISLSDLLPEVQFHQHDRLQLSTALMVGIGIAYMLEKSHSHF